MKERLQKILSNRGVASRRAAEAMLTAGRITVNGAVAVLGQQADPEADEILLDGRPLPSAQNFVYILLKKPRDNVTTLSDEKGRPNVAQLVDCGTRVYPVGRLDMDSEGLLLLTNDGDFANGLMHPKHEVKKTYRVWVKGYRPGAEVRLSKPVTLDGYTIRKPEVKLIHAQQQSAQFRVTIHEGRNRQIRRMCELADMTVTRLQRISEGSVQLGDLEPGSWRHLTEDEVAAFRGK